jgi:hypothetical protein
LSGNASAKVTRDFGCVGQCTDATDSDTCSPICSHTNVAKRDNVFSANDWRNEVKTTYLTAAEFVSTLALAQAAQAATDPHHPFFGLG